MYPLNWPLSFFFASLGMPLLIKIAVVFDPVAKVYIATSQQLRGLVIEAASLDDVHHEVQMAVPELLELNHLNTKNKLPNHTNLQFNTQLMPA
jgi:Domain of unknown function (DUF1902)